MKKIIIVIIVIALGAAAYYMLKPSTPQEQITPQPIGNDTSKPNPSNGVFVFEEGSVTLSNGTSEVTIPDSALIEEVELLDMFAYGDVNSDGKNDTALLLTRYGGGSGTFIYAAVFASGPVGYKGSRAFFIGDRISPQSISISGNTITVNYLDRRPDQAFSEEPTIPASKQFVFQNGQLHER